MPQPQFSVETVIAQHLPGTAVCSTSIHCSAVRPKALFPDYPLFVKNGESTRSGLTRLIVLLPWVLSLIVSRCISALFMGAYVVAINYFIQSLVLKGDWSKPTVVC